MIQVHFLVIINSPYPALGPDPKNLISFEIFIKATAHVFNAPEKFTIASCAAKFSKFIWCWFKR